MTKSEIAELRAKIISGVQLALKRLILSRQKEDGELIFSHDGKIVRVKARNLKVE